MSGGHPGQEELAGQPRRGGAKRTLAIVLVVVLVVVLIFGALAGIYAWRFVSAYQNLSISPVDLDQVPNGIYLGSWKIFHVEVSVSVAVKDHQIVAIDVLDAGASGNSGTGKASLETLSERIIGQQSVQVDTVSGATATQKAFLKAVEEARRSSSEEDVIRRLEQGRRNPDEGAVIYHSKWGNCKEVAENIAAGLAESGFVVSIFDVDSSGALESGLEFMVAGSPTRVGKATGAMRKFIKRKVGKEWVGKTYAAFGTGMRGKGKGRTPRGPTRSTNCRGIKACCPWPLPSRPSSPA